MAANRTHPRRRLRALSLALAVTTLLAAGLLPACIPGLCCPINDAPTVHAQMPCCQGESSIASREPLRVRPATFASNAPSPQSAAVLAQHATAFTVAPARVPAKLAAGQTAQHEPSPPLFLLNAQFLI